MKIETKYDIGSRLWITDFCKIQHTIGIFEVVIEGVFVGLTSSGKCRYMAACEHFIGSEFAFEEHELHESKDEALKWIANSVQINAIEE